MSVAVIGAVKVGVPMDRVLMTAVVTIDVSMTGVRTGRVVMSAAPRTGEMTAGVRTGRVVTIVVMTAVLTIAGQRVDVRMARAGPMVDDPMTGAPRIAPKVVGGKVAGRTLADRTLADRTIVAAVVVMIDVMIVARRVSSSVKSEPRRTRPSVVGRLYGHEEPVKSARDSSKPRSIASPSVGSTKDRFVRQRWPPRSEPSQRVLVEPKTLLSTRKSRRKSRPHSNRVARRVSVIAFSKPRSRSKVSASPMLVEWPIRCSRRCPTYRRCTR